MRCAIFDNTSLYAFSNVYCGANARRDCNGNYEDVACPPGVDPGSFQEIPFLREVNCVKFLQVIDANTNLSCGGCQGDEDGLYLIECDEVCLGCNGDEECFSQKETLAFSEGRDINQVCYENQATGDVACNVIAGPAGRSTGGLRLHGCAVEVNGSECSCSVCGFKSGSDRFGLGWYAIGEVLYEAQCPDGSGFNQCTGTGSGVYGTGALDSNLQCPLEMGSMPVPPPPTMMNPVVVPSPATPTAPNQPAPVAPVVQPVTPPMATPVAAAPVFQPTVVPPTTPEATAPVVQPAAIPPPMATPVAAAPVVQPATTPVTSPDAPFVSPVSITPEIPMLPISEEAPPLTRQGSSAGSVTHVAIAVVALTALFFVL